MVILLFLCVTLVIACGERPVRIDRDMQNTIDTIASKQIAVLNSQMDSLCDLQFDSLVQVYVDSIMNVRLEEIELLIDK